MFFISIKRSSSKALIFIFVAAGPVLANGVNVVWSLCHLTRAGGVPLLSVYQR